jgi:hypothetical protein
VEDPTPENAKVLCEKILSLSPLIGHASIINSNGTIILEINRETRAKSGVIDKELQDNYGLLVSIISGVAQQAETPFGTMNYICVAYAKLKLAVIPTKDLRILISIAKHADIEKIAPLVRDLLN